MIVYRISKKEFANDLSGSGAKLYGGRWNSKGVAAVYTSVYRSLAALEMAVHASAIIHNRGFSLITIQTGNFPIPTIDKKIPAGWSSYPLQTAIQKFGDSFLMDPNCPGFIVPSSIVFEEFNIILNPNYKNFKHVKIIYERSYTPDKRIQQK